MLRTFLKKVLPWLVTAGIFAYLFHKYPLQTIYNSLKYINIYLFCVVGTGYVVFMYIIDTFSISKVLKRFGHESSVKELLPARGLTYLIMVINYAASQAAFAFYQYRKHGLAISEMLGIFGIIVVIDLYLLATLAFISTFFTAWPFEIAGMGVGHFVRLFTLTAYAVFGLNIIFWRGGFGRIGFLEKLRTKDFFSVLARARPSDYLHVALARLPVHTFIMGGLYVAVLTFNAHIPFVKVLANIPLVFFIGALPITPGGLGTTNVALVELFKPYVTAPSISSGAVGAGELLLSFSLLWVFVNYALKALIGVICLKFVSKDLFKPVDKVPTETVIPEVTRLADDL